jgi:hypothetical protein
MLQRKTLLHPMYAPASNDSTLYALLPIAPTSYILAFDPAPYFPKSMLLFLFPCFLYFCFISPYILCSCFQYFNSLCPAPFAPTQYVLAFDPASYFPKSMLLFLIPLLPMLLLCIPLHPMFLLLMLQLFMPCSLCSYLVHPCI